MKNNIQKQTFGKSFIKTIHKFLIDLGRPDDDKCIPFDIDDRNELEELIKNELKSLLGDDK